MDIKRIPPVEAQKLLDAGAGWVYVDVRTVPEFDAGHVPGAKNIPVLEPNAYGQMQLNPRFVETVAANFGKDTPCITGCQKGGRSLKAAELLLAAGFTNVVDMLGGYGDGWAPQGLPTTRDSDPGDRYESLAKK